MEFKVWGCRSPEGIGIRLPHHQCLLSFFSPPLRDSVSLFVFLFLPLSLHPPHPPLLSLASDLVLHFTGDRIQLAIITELFFTQPPGKGFSSFSLWVLVLNYQQREKKIGYHQGWLLLYMCVHKFTPKAHPYTGEGGVGEKK